MIKQVILCFGFLCFLVSASQQLLAQSSVHGTIADSGGNAIKDASVLLLKYSDSSLVKGTLSNNAGKYTFENIPKGAYLVSASFTGKQQVFSKVFELNQDKIKKDIGIISLPNPDIALKAVTLAVRKPMFEQKIDRIIINVKNSITDAGGTALDVLSKSPGVTVNLQDNTIAINGKNGVVVMINGKITYMPMDAIVQLLAGISASNIDKIELITTPPAKYDAEGNAGYINIVLVNNPYQGANGSYFLTGGYGKRPLGSAGGNFNYRTSRINLFLNYNFNYIQKIQPGTGFTQLTKGSDIITNNSFTHRKFTTQVHNLRVGLDYQLDTATIIGALVSGYNNHSLMTANNGSTVQTNGILDTTISTVDHEINHWQNIMTNLNFQHTFKPGKVLYFDANYIYYKNNDTHTYFNQYYKGSSNFLYDENVRSGKITPINFKVFSTDYTTTIGKKITMEAGAKVSFSRLNNDVSLENLQGTWITDTTLSANYLLKENIGAAYTSFTTDLNSKTSIKAGIRYEYTSSNLGTQQTANIVNRKYGELFPTFSISQKINDDNSIDFSYSRRITRPTFNDLAPFTIFFTPKSYFTGNPALQPAIANTVQASYVFKNYIFSLSFTHEDNTIESFQTQRIDTLTNIVYYWSQNSKYEQYATASFSLPFIITKWWTMQNNINIDWRQVNTTYNNSPVQLHIFDYDLSSTQHFTLDKDLAFELTGFYTSAGYFGTNKYNPIYQVDAGIQKKFSNKKDIIRISANDMFNSSGNFVFKSDLPIDGTIIRASVNFGSVAYKLTWTHSFGNKALKVKGQRSTGAEEELNRVHN